MEGLDFQLAIKARINKLNIKTGNCSGGLLSDTRNNESLLLRNLMKEISA